VNQSDFADLLIDFYCRVENLFLLSGERGHVQSDSQTNPGFGFYYARYELVHSDFRSYWLEINVNMIKPESGKRGYKALNVWLMRSPAHSHTYRWWRPDQLLWMQDDPTYGFDYRFFTKERDEADCVRPCVEPTNVDEIASLITDTANPYLMGLDPGLLLYELAGI
jgi:hypothetical protein